MIARTHTGLSRSQRPVIMGASVTSLAFLWLVLLPRPAFPQQAQQSQSDDLDVTMQIIVDPDAKLPEEVVRRIPLPARKPAQQTGPVADDARSDKADAAAKGQERAREAQELGREISDSALERSREAAEQREQARRSAVETRRREPRPPPEPPGPPRN